MSTKAWVPSVLMVLAVFVRVSFAAPAAPTSDIITFKKHGKMLATYRLADLESKVPPRDITVQEPQEEKAVSFKAMPVRTIFELVYGKTWMKEDEVLFTCADGYQPSIPRAEFQASQALFAFAKTDGSPFQVHETRDHEKDVALAPLYLVWDNQHDQRLLAEGAYGWPFQVTTIDLVRFSDKFPKLAPPEKSSENVTKGFGYYRKYCLECHALNGDGGGRGPELTAVLPTLDDAQLAHWISDPQATKPQTTMPTFNPKLKGEARQSTITAIIAYLRTMAKTPTKK